MTPTKKTSVDAAQSAPATSVTPASPQVSAAPAPAAPVLAKKAPRAKAVVKKIPAKKQLTAKSIAKKTPARPLLARAPVPAKAEKPAAPAKAKKTKLVRDSFTIPKTEYGMLEVLKQRAAKLTRPVKKSELLRAGIKMLAAASDAAYLAALDAVPAIKTGRPALKK